MIEINFDRNDIVNAFESFRKYNELINKKRLILVNPKNVDAVKLAIKNIGCKNMICNAINVVDETKVYIVDLDEDWNSIIKPKYYEKYRRG